ncbi:MAG TPA: hypothetical protein EYP90_03830, partial [Chromatiaceae bacterium]|nr:hypothetical protein [Chromatiaceae bacterium]
PASMSKIMTAYMVSERLKAGSLSLERIVIARPAVARA